MQHDLKSCKKCGEAKPLALFYANDNSCKECRKAMVRAARARNIEHYREFDRQRASRPDRVAAREAYSKTDAFKQSHAKAVRKYRERLPDMFTARTAVGNALRDGKLEKLPCWVCGAANSEAHHPDYSAPLAVTWLCDKHHKETHKMANELRRKAAAPLGLQSRFSVLVM
ncbi:hypothetical protein [Aquitalea sp. USM4]|uniref:hypothetical protein n=1 Tax=Aquitalea sp. USM4 TaxID=1590041 RepID=UPI00103A85B8|nr:hypothetical protein [Aquitalea sp. USM4]QBJ80547.1 hypothetical protein DKK66_20090 [Aquitalea sp. USM4]